MALGIGAGLALGGAAQAAASLLGNKKSTATQVPMLTGEAVRSMRALEEIFNTGSFGTGENRITLGEDLGLPSGSYDLSPDELAAIERTRGRFNEEPTGLMRAIDATLGFLDDSDPYDTFEPFRTRVQREVQESSDALKRNAAFMGNLYGTKTIENLGEVQTQGNEIMASELARLTEADRDRRLQAAGMTGSLSSILEGIQRGRISDLLGVGSMERDLTNAGIAEQRGDILRSRAEDLSRIDALSTILGTPTQFGIPSITTNQPGPYQGILDFASRIGGDIVGMNLQQQMLQGLMPQVGSGGGGMPAIYKTNAGQYALPGGF